MKKHILFVCSANLDRSPLAESLFDGSEEYEAKSCGTFPHAQIPVSKEAIEWADIIFCMKDEHKRYLIDNFRGVFDKEVIVLNVDNEFARNDPRLEEVLRRKLSRWL